MPRPQKCRRICSAPKQRNFHAENDQNQEHTIEITLEEFETVRLIDYENMTQEECAAQMLSKGFIILLAKKFLPLL